MRRIYYALFVLAILALSVWLVIHYDVLTLARAFLTPVARWLAGMTRMVSGPLFQRVTLVARPLIQNYLIRRAESPVWALLMQGALALIGYRLATRLTARVKSVAAYGQKGVAWWKTRHRLIRWGVGSTLVFGAGFLGFGVFILPMWIPLTGRLMQSVHFFWFDQVVNRWIAPMQRKYRHMMRTNRFWRAFRRPYRIVFYWVLLGVRNSARWLRRTFASAWAVEQKVQHRLHSHPRSANLADHGPAQ